MAEKNKKRTELKYNKKELSLGEIKFNSIFAAMLVDMLVAIVLSMTNSVIIGNIVGTDGLSACSCVTPLTTGALFIGGVLSSGTSIAFTGAQGDFDPQKASRITGTAVVLAAVFGIILMLTSVFLIPVYLKTLKTGAEVYDLAIHYRRFLSLYMLLLPIKNLCTMLVYTDGGEKVGMVSSVVNVVGNMVFSVILGKMLGITGVSLGMLVSNVIAFCLLFIHIFGKKSSVRPAFCFSFKETWKIICIGFGSETMYFYTWLLNIVCNHIVTTKLGNEYFPILSMVYAALSLNIVPEMAGEGIKPIVGVYIKDKNVSAIKRVLKHALKVNIAGGLFLTLFFLAAAPILPNLVNIDSQPFLYEICVRGLRIFSVACLPMSFITLFDSYWYYIGRKKPAIVSNALKYFVCTAGLAAILTDKFGVYGFWSGFALSPLLSIIILSVWGIVFNKNGRFPVLLEDNNDTADFYTVLEEKNIVKMCEGIGEFLALKNVSAKTVNIAELAVEETLMLTKQNNSNKVVHAECSVYVSDEYITIVIWEDGELGDVTDEENGLSDLRHYVVNSMIYVMSKHNYMMSVGFNRTKFKIVNK